MVRAKKTTRSEKGPGLCPSLEIFLWPTQKHMWALFDPLLIASLHASTERNF